MRFVGRLPLTEVWRLERCEPFSRAYEGVLVTVTVAGCDIEATADHPFFVLEGEALAGRPLCRHVGEAEQAAVLRATGHRWVAAGELRPGDVLPAINGRPGTVTSVRLRPAATRVYNLTVSGSSTYAVGGAGWLVHNNNHCGQPAPRLARHA